MNNLPFYANTGDPKLDELLNRIQLELKKGFGMIVNNRFWVSQTTGTLPREENVGDLGDGIIKNVGGEPAIAVPGVDYALPGSSGSTAIPDGLVVFGNVTSDGLDYDTTFKYDRVLENLGIGTATTAWDATVGTRQVTIMGPGTGSGYGQLNLGRPNAPGLSETVGALRFWSNTTEVAGIASYYPGADTGYGVIYGHLRGAGGLVRFFRANHLTSLEIGNRDGLSTSATDGFVHIPTVAGSPNAVPSGTIIAATGAIAMTTGGLMHYDTDWRYPNEGNFLKLAEFDNGDDGTAFSIFDAVELFTGGGDTTRLLPAVSAGLRDHDGKIWFIKNTDPADTLTIGREYALDTIDGVVGDVTLAAGESMLVISRGGSPYDWQTMRIGSAIGGAVSSGEIPYGSASNTLASEAAFAYNAGTNTLSVDNVTIATNLTVSAAGAINLGNASATFGVFGATAVGQRTSGADLTNNVTSGGTDDTIDNWTDLGTYATDAAAIRNAVYQLARKQKQINDGLRDLGYFT